jgi:hypothetical protein
MADDLKDSIAENAQGPRRAQGDSGSMEQHSLPDQIAADKYLASKQALQRRTPPIKMFKLRPPGAAGVDFTNSSGNCP